ncbi:FAD/NAD(P)-binding protein [Halostreptopolyspora alba]|uniref:FAD-dependent urate hydroxylase HpyO/Asp monooxygenase CreE-like FAD/NAD(P)-binding domain-containing protein n=1 Tax=Halostreptopolyspora alba TaxID=2487137 RepID=A0A3N0EBB1_9ACTN|nr:hypothetical protein EFW17_10440 [Nocardiopsaceae bacterium YIM 96095]
MGHRASCAGSGPVIAFAGGGASATLAAVALLRATTWLRLSYRIVLFDEHGRHARGSGYPADESDQLLDTPVKNMSALPDRPCHLMEWAHWRGVACDPGTRLPRAVYGDYLAETLADTASWARPHAEVRYHTVRVAGASLDDGTTEIRLPHGERVAASAVVVATGDPVVHPPPRITGTGGVAGDDTSGLVTCSRGALVTQWGAASRRIFALGPARQGHRVDGIPQIRTQAEVLAQRIADTVLRDRAAPEDIAI